MDLFVEIELFLLTSHPFLLIFPDRFACIKNYSSDTLADYQRCTVELNEVWKEPIYVSSDAGMMYDMSVLEVQRGKGMVRDIIWHLIH